MATNATIDTCRGEEAENRLGSEFGTMFQMAVPLFLEIPEFPVNTIQDKPKIASLTNNRLGVFLRFDRTPD